MTEEPRKSRRRKPRVPELTAVLIAERILVEQDGTVSVVRLIDQFSAELIEPQEPEEWPPVPYQGWMLLAFRSGGAGGRFTVRVDVINPSGRRREGSTVEIELDGSNPANGINQIVELRVPMTEPGLHWFEVVVEGRAVRRTPLTFLRGLAPAAGAEATSPAAPNSPLTPAGKGGQ